MATINAFQLSKKTQPAYNTDGTVSNVFNQAGNGYSTPNSYVGTGTYTQTPSPIKPSQQTAYTPSSGISSGGQTSSVNPFSVSLSSYNNSANDYLKRMQELAGIRVDQQGQQRQQSENTINSNYDRVRDYYSGLIPTLQGRFDQYQTDANATLEEMRQATDRSKASTRNQYLGAQRDALVAQRNNQAALDQKHAALGTVDSSFYTKDNANLIADANRFRETSNMAMADRLAEMDAELATAERQAQQAILQERNNLEDAVRQINFELGNNEGARQEALNTLLANYNNSINGIYENLAGIEYNLAQERWQYEQQIAQSMAQQDTSSLSQQFMQTGIPQTEADYRYYVENAGNYDKLGKLSGGITAEDVKTGQDINRLVSSLLGDSSGLNSIVGAIQGRVPAQLYGQNGQLALSQLQQIENLLTVKARQALQGQGQISDAETRMLASAQSILGNRKISDAQMREELMRIQEEAQNLMNGNVTYNNSGYSDNVLSQDQIAQILAGL